MRIFLLFIASQLSLALFAQTNKVDKQMIKGRWISEDDKKYSVAFIDSMKIDYYERDITSRYRYVINSDSLLTEDMQTKETSSFIIMGITSKHLTLMYPDRGNLLKFKKAPQHK